MSNTVDAQTSASAVSASSRRAMNCAPAPGEQLGCSLHSSGGTIHDTSGSVPPSTSSRVAATMSPPVVPVLAGTEPIPRSYKGLPGAASRNCANQASALSSKLSAAFWYTFQLTPAACSRSGYVVQRKPEDR